uniref:Secretory protein 18H08 n=1 Tax=Heterodera glycines TaxID=51029 RepID=A0A7D6DSP3_HETGL|nr:secretory protein 18H08 [Heterodera glycines]
MAFLLLSLAPLFVALSGIDANKVPLQLCCAGGQSLAGLIYDYSDHFSEVLQQSGTEMCTSLKKDMTKLTTAIEKAEGCKCNLVEKIEKELDDVEDDCAYNLSFIRALFHIVAMASEHLGESWNSEAAEFNEQIEAIDSIGHEELKKLEFEAESELKTHPRVGRKRMNRG